MNRRLAGRVLPRPGGQHLSQDDLVHVPRSDAGSCEQGRDDVGSEPTRGKPGERATERADGGPTRRDDYDILDSLPSSAGVTEYRW